MHKWFSHNVKIEKLSHWTGLLCYLSKFRRAESTHRSPGLGAKLTIEITNIGNLHINLCKQPFCLSSPIFYLCICINVVCIFSTCSFRSNIMNWYSPFSRCILFLHDIQKISFPIIYSFLIIYSILCIQPTSYTAFFPSNILTILIISLTI